MRYERKFFIEESSVEQLKARVKLHPFSFIQAFPDRTINNIYFDDQDYSLLNDNLDGNSERQKVRIRWYGSDSGQLSEARLEIKSKIGLTGTKKYFEFPDLPLSDMTGIAEKVNELLFSGNLQPTLIVKYHRTYYESFNRHIRLTLDTDMKTKKYEGYWEELKGIVMEVKYPPEKEAEVAEMMQYFPFRMSKHSKYTLGMTSDLI